ncbi:MAG TPA: hypothetical protein VJ793_27920 [Anaerolineae bacterium]|nr:hypothetical protein [Anaerolineae bacterium]
MNIRTSINIRLILLVLMLAACDAPVPQGESPMPTPAANTFTSPVLPLITAIPTPSGPDTATITGVLLENPSSPRPVAGAIVYLAHILPEASGKPYLAGLDKVSSPRAQTDGAGRFVFADVPEGMYALILDRIYEAFLLNDPDDGSDFIFEPEPGRVLDLGNLVYSSLPGENPVP